MRRTSRLLVLFGIGLAVLTFVLIVALLPGQSPNGTANGPSPTPIVNVQVVEAAVDIPLGTVVTGDMLTTATIPVGNAAGDSFRDPSLVIGQTARRAILTGAQVRGADFALNQGAAQITPPAGKRAMAIAVGDLTGVGRLIYPGDTVDIVLTFDTKAIKVVIVNPDKSYTYDAGANATTVKAPLLLQDIQVLGTIDQPTQQTEPAGASPAPSAGPVLDLAANKLIILAVTDSQAEAILFARTAGTEIDLFLRAPADTGTTETTDGVILKTFFAKYGVLPPYVIKAIDANVPNQP